MIRKIMIFSICLLLVFVFFVPVSGDEPLPTESPTTLVTTEPSPVITQLSTIPLVASFSGTPVSGIIPLIVQFNDTSVGSPTSWDWSFGDGYSSAEQDPVHTYQTSGNYTVSLKVTNSDENSSISIPHYITVLSIPAPTPLPTLSTTPVQPTPTTVSTIPLVASFSGTPVSGITPLIVQFNDTSVGSSTSWDWSFGDGYSSAEQDPVHTYQTSGNYTVSLRVTNSDENSSIITPQYITVLSKASLPQSQSLLLIRHSRILASHNTMLYPIGRDLFPH